MKETFTTPEIVHTFFEFDQQFNLFKNSLFFILKKWFNFISNLTFETDLSPILFTHTRKCDFTNTQTSHISAWIQTHWENNDEICFSIPFKCVCLLYIKSIEAKRGNLATREVHPYDTHTHTHSYKYIDTTMYALNASMQWIVIS